MQNHQVHGDGGIGRLWKTATIVAAGLVLCSCAAIPDLGPAPQPESANSLGSQQSLAGSAGDWPNQSWWSSFGDAQLDQLMIEAIAHSPTMVQAQARLEKAIAITGVANAALYPSLAANASINREKLSYNSIFPASAVPRGSNDLTQTTLDFSWELDFWGKNRSILSAAVSEARAADADAAGAKLLITTKLAETYIQLQYDYDLHDVNAETLRNRQDSVRLAKQRLAQGLDTQISVEEAAARESLAQADLAEAEERIVLTRNGLAALLGRGPDRGIDIARPNMSIMRTIGLPRTLNADIMGRKPEVVAARWRVESAAKKIGVARTAFYPDVNLVGFIGFQALGINRLTESGSNISGIGPAIHLPIFEGGQLRANYRGARADYDLAVAMYDETLTQTLRETADAARSLDALKARTIATDEGFARSEKAYGLAKARYEGGLADFQTVLTAEDIKLQAQMADTAIHIRGYYLNVALVKALGGGFESNSIFSEEVKP